MRFAILVMGAVALGAGSVTGFRTVVQQGGSMADAVRAFGGNAASLKLGDINIDPRKAYEDVKRQITSGQATTPFPVSSPTPTSFTRLDPGKINTFKFDEASMKRAMGASINAQIQQNYRRSQDMAAYARSPMSWHGAPPH